MPTRIRSFCSFGKYYNIEVEDDVTAYLEYANGATGVYITSTGEAPGTNRLEISGDMGKLTIENNKLTFLRNRISEREHNRVNTQPFAKPECWQCDVPVSSSGGEQHNGILRNFAQAVLKGTPLLAPGEEGINGLLISNAIHYSTWTDGWAELDQFDHDHFYELLQERINGSTVDKKQVESKVADLTGTH